MAKTGKIETMIDLEVISCPSCFMAFGAPERLFEKRREDGNYFYCPNGHSMSYKDNEIGRLRCQLTKAQDHLAIAGQRTKEAWAVADSNRQQLNKLKRRVQAGVCSLCHRTFQNVQRHMTNKHKEEVDGE